MKRIIAITLPLLMLHACTPSPYHISYIDLPGAKWDADSAIIFPLPVSQTDADVTLHISLRTTPDVPCTDMTLRMDLLVDKEEDTAARSMNLQRQATSAKLKAAHDNTGQTDGATDKTKDKTAADQNNATLQTQATKTGAGTHQQGATASHPQQPGNRQTQADATASPSKQDNAWAIKAERMAQRKKLKPQLTAARRKAPLQASLSPSRECTRHSHDDIADNPGTLPVFSRLVPIHLYEGERPIGAGMQIHVSSSEAQTLHLEAGRRYTLRLTHTMRQNPFPAVPSVGILLEN